MDIVEKLHNCPNCGGTLQDDGACRFCGSKVYDFLSVDLKDHKPTYIRMKVNKQIIILPVKFDTAEINIYDNRSVLYCDSTPYIEMGAFIPTGVLHFTATGSIIVEDTEITGSEY